MSRALIILAGVRGLCTIIFYVLIRHNEAIYSLPSESSSVIGSIGSHPQAL